MTSSPAENPNFKSGPLAFMAQHPVAANLLMIIFLVGGFIMTQEIRQEVFPDYFLHEIRINVSYSGASPEDVEQAMLLPVEDAIQNVPGIHRSYSIAREGGGRVTVELVGGVSPELAMNEIQAAVDGISIFPDDVDRPNISLRTARVNVLTVVIYGDVDERTLRELGENTREGLLSQPEISRVALAGMRAPEMSIEARESTLRAHGLTIDEVASIVGSAAVEVPGGGLKTPGGEILVRTSERKEQQREFEDIIILADPEGGTIRLSDIAEVHDGFRDLNRLTYYDGKQAARLIVARVGDQTPMEVSRATRRYLDEHAQYLPPGVEYALWEDESEEFSDRIDLLLKNAYLGLFLVLLVLGLFLNIKLAFWVTLGIPIAFLGSLIFMPLLGVSFNMISLFAFILCLGIIVDYAIVVGEAIYKQREEGNEPLTASILGVREVAGPLCISLLTTCTVFLPLLAIPGTTGNLFEVIPIVVVLVLVLSLIEALVILPAHLSRSQPTKWTGVLAQVMKYQAYFGRTLNEFIENQYRPALLRAISFRYFTMAAGVTCLLILTALVFSGRMNFHFFPPVEGNVSSVNIRMPFGTDAELTHEVGDRVLDAAYEVIEELGGEETIHRGILTEQGRGAPGSGPTGSAPGARSHIARISVDLVSADERDFTTAEFTDRWREKIGEVPGVEAMLYSYSSGLDTGAAVALQLHHPNSASLERAAEDLAETLREIRGVLDVDSGVARGKEQLDIQLRPESRSLGLTESSLGRQLRAAFFGVEAVRLQRGREELRVYVRRPLEERQSEDHIETMILRTPGGGEVPLSQAASIQRSRGHVTIQREGGQRIVEVTAAVDDAETTGNEVMATLRAGPLDELVQSYPGLGWSVSGEQAEQEEALDQLIFAMLLALFTIYILLAFTFRSYIQPLIIMIIIPFGCIGAIVGHLLMGATLSFMSVMGMIALSGIVVNVSLILLATANHYIRQGLSVHEAIVAGACRRFRPIVLTAATTFIGLTPMIFETSVQAEFLVPMAISMGFGILFGTVICLFFVPCSVIILDDTRRLIARRLGSEH